MNHKQARDLVLLVLRDIAPEVDQKVLDPDADFTEQLDLDSMDYLNWMLGINEQTGIEIPERDYSRLMTLNDAGEYLMAASADM